MNLSVNILLSPDLEESRMRRATEQRKSRVTQCWLVGWSLKVKQDNNFYINGNSNNNDDALVLN